MKHSIVKPILLTILFSAILSGQTYSIPDSSENIRVTLSAEISHKSVPLNRTFSLSVKVLWEGDQNRIEIVKIEEPILSNCEITGTSVSNRVTGTSGSQKAERKISYKLKPHSLGMAYIEEVLLTYKDRKTDKTYTLKTERLSVEVVDPVPENVHKSNLWILFLFLGVLITIVIISLFIIKKRSEGKIAPQPQRIIEEIYLEELKKSVDLKAKKTDEAFGVLSRLFRRYLSEKFGISATQLTTQQLLKKLEETDLDENTRRKCEKLFTTADVVKFSGHDATQSELEDGYTTVETILESNLSKMIEERQRAEQQISKGKKILKIF